MLFYGFIVSVSLSVLVLLVLFVHIISQRRAFKHLKAIGIQAAEGNLPQVINSSYNKITSLSDDLEKLNGYYSKLYRLTGATLQNIGLIRYNAFEEMGGNLSFSLALLNNQKDGVVFTSINGRDESRIFVKQIIAGISNDHPMTKEENQAVSQALKAGRNLFSEKSTASKKTSRASKKNS